MFSVVSLSKRMTCWFEAMIRLFLVVTREASLIIFISSNGLWESKEVISWELCSFPTTEKIETFASSECKLFMTLPAPPKTVLSLCVETICTGASGEIRLHSPQM